MSTSLFCCLPLTRNENIQLKKNSIPAHQSGRSLEILLVTKKSSQDYARTHEILDLSGVETIYPGQIIQYKITILPFTTVDMECSYSF